MVFRIGNITLLETSFNRDLGTKTYEEKRVSYKKSGFAITQKLAEENLEWTPAKVTAHQSWMAKQAKSIWRIEQLS
jgi:hypothetical protein